MRAVVAGGEAERVSEARRILLSEGLTCEAEDAVGYERLPDSLAAVQPDVVLIYCDGAGNEGLAAIETAHHLVAGPVLAVGDPDVALMRDAMRAGAREYLDRNNLRHDLTLALSSLEAARPEPSKRGQIIGVYSPIRGAGTTTIALNLAVTLGKLQPPESASVALVDITPPPSELSLLLDLTPRHTLADVLLHRDRLDRRLLAGAMTPHESGIQVLPQAGFTEDLRVPAFPLDPAVVRQMFVLLRKNFEWTVVDLGHAVGEAQLEAIRLSNCVVLPVVADVPGLRRVRWLLDLAESQGISRDRFQVVLNRSGARNQVPRQKVEDALHASVLTTVGDFGPALTNARNEGQPAIEISGSLASAFGSLAKTIRRSTAGVQA